MSSGARKPRTTRTNSAGSAGRTSFDTQGFVRRIIISYNFIIMFIATHSIAGGILGDAIGNPILAFLCGFILHFVLDAIPHEYSHKTKKLAVIHWTLFGIDLIITYFLWKSLFSSKLSFSSSFLWGAVGGIGPDLIDNVPIIEDYFRKTKIGMKFHNIHGNIQSVEVGIVAGTLIQYGLLTTILLFFK